MRVLAVLILTACQFTAFPFLAIVTANTVRQGEAAQYVRHADLPNVTTIYKTVRMLGDGRVSPRRSSS